MTNHTEYNIEFPDGLHAGIMRRVELWRMRRTMFAASFVILGASLGAVALASRSVGVSLRDNGADEAIAALFAGAEYNLSYVSYAVDVLATVLPLETVVLTLANLAVAVAMGGLMISFRKQLVKGRTFSSQ